MNNDKNISNDADSHQIDSHLSIASDITCAYVSNNRLDSESLTGLLEEVFNKVAELDSRQTTGVSEVSVRSKSSQNVSAGNHSVSDKAQDDSEREWNKPVRSQPVTEPAPIVAKKTDTDDRKSGTQNNLYEPDWEAIDQVAGLNPPNAVDSNGNLIPHNIYDLVPDDNGYIFDRAWIRKDAKFKNKPAVPLSRSVKRATIVDLNTGAVKIVLTRGLGNPEDNTQVRIREYRDSWGLTEHYPIKAPDYVKERSEGAKARGLGRKRRE